MKKKNESFNSVVLYAVHIYIYKKGKNTSTKIQNGKLKIHEEVLKITIK